MNDDSLIESEESESKEGLSLRHQVISSMAWLAGLKYLGQIITWAATIVVIRLLSPADYGLMAKAAVFIAFMVMISELGLEGALIQKKSISYEELTHVFGLIICSNIILFMLLFFSSPAIAAFYSDDRLVLILRALSSIFLFMPLYIVPRGLLIRDMNFKLKSIVDLIGALITAGVTLVLALLDFGVWALVWGNIASHAVFAIGYNLVQRRIFLPRFALRGYGHFLSFGGFLTGSRILWYFYSRSDIFIGGRFLTNKLLGVYSIAIQFATIPIEKLMPIVGQVAFPAYSHIQSQVDLVRSHFKKSVRLVSFIIFPLYGGLIIVASPLVNIVLGSKWNEIVLPLTILGLIIPFRALSTLFPPALNGLGRPDVVFFNVAIATAIMPAGFFVGVRWGVIGICWVWVVGYAAVFMIMSTRSLHVLRVSIAEFLGSFGVPLICTVGMVLGIALLNYYLGGFLAPSVQLAGYTILGIIIYLSLVFVLKRDYLIEAWQMIRVRRQ